MSKEGWIKTTCAYCGVGCGVEARPMSNGLLEIRGDKQHPANFGKLCTKGIALGETVITDGRLLAPTLVTDKTQSRQEQTLSWDDATQLVAEKFKQTIQEHGPDSVAFYVSGQLLTEDYYVANKLIKGFIGTANIDSNSRLCMASSVVGHKRAFGTDTVPVVYQDLEHADLVVLTGSNLAWCHPVLFQRLKIAKQTRPEMKVVVIDPRQTATCEIADLHLAIESGSDVALFNGLLRYLADHDQLNQAYISQHTQGFESALQGCLNVVQAAEITGIDSELLTQFYQLFADTDKTITVYSQGVNQSSQGADKVNSILNCHLATGRIGQQGSGPFSVTGQPNAMGGREVGGLANTLASHLEFDKPEDVELVKAYWESDNVTTKPGLKAIDLFDAIDAGKVKAVWIMATNPVVSLPDTEKVKRALANCPFVVVSDCIKETETTALADLLLPSQGWSEKSGTVTNSERRISRQRRILASPGMAKPDWWILTQVAKKMGYSRAFNYLHEGQIFNEYAKMTTINNTRGENRDLNLIGLTQLDDSGYSKLTPQQWPVLEYQTELQHQRMFSNGQFYTASGRANFVTVQYSKPKSTTDQRYPLLLNSGRARDHWHTMSRTGLAPSLAMHTPEPYVSVHPDTAKQFKLTEGGIANISNGDIDIQARVDLDSGMARNQIFMPIHWNEATASNGKPCALIAPYADPISGQPEFKHTPVKVESWAYRCEALVLTRSPLDLGSMDYWVKQKLPQGYLYRVASQTASTDLVLQLSQLMQSETGKTLAYDGQESEYRQAIVRADRMQRAFVVKQQLSDDDLEWLKALFDETEADSIEQQFLAI
ncbi:molybdopterin oxidoreductase family protein [Vibrio hippocampi]|uniref:Nitrate reductase n=1 Tax=Vibrio hippocampi TaxID=654686 RepID=A0ABN8DGF9_9VIBR|nr:nitrate reductase [Vibrio hippocampi]CAH0525539.1 Nitrate reductase [Vibrio hippocampi]